MGVNVIIFLVAQGYSHIVDLFALNPSTVGSQPWTILTSIFTHYDFFHILFNMLSLYFLGTFLLQLVGTRWFLLVYFAGGIVGSIFYVLISLVLPSAPAIGASGAIFALGGALVLLRPQTRVMIIPIPVPMPLWAAIIGSFVVLTILGFTLGGIAWQAHLGGLVFGLAAGYFLRDKAGRVIL